MHGLADPARLDHHLQAVVTDDVAVALGEIVTNLLGVTDSRACQDLRHRHEPRGNAEGIRVERPCVADLTRDHLIHDRPRSADRRERESAPNRLPEALAIRPYA